MPPTKIQAFGTALWATIYVNVAAATLPAVLPVMIGVLADQLGFGAVHAGYVASANLAGIAAGSLLCATAARRFSWSAIIRCGAGLMIGTNVVSLLVSSFPAFMLARGASGLGEGMISAVCYAAMSRSVNSGRAMALYVAGQGLVGAVGMGSIPGIVAVGGWRWLFVLVSVVALPAFFLAPLVGTQRGLALAAAPGGRRFEPAPVIALGCILVYFIGMSAVWSFTERLGHAKSIDLAHLSLALSASAIANMGGSLLIGFLAHRVSIAAGLLVGAAVAILGLAMLVSSAGWQPYLVAVSLFFLSWGLYYPFQFKLLADTDGSGGTALLIPLVSGGGFTLGPAIGGRLLEAGGAGLLCSFGAFCVALSTVSALLLYWRRPHRGVYS